MWAFRRLLGWVGDGSLRFAPCANPRDVVRLPGFEFGIEYPESVDRQALLERFADPRRAIERWFSHREAARKACFTLLTSHNLPPVLGWGWQLLRGAQDKSWSRRTLADELQQIGDPRLQAAGGECRLGATVQRMRVDDGRVAGVEVRQRDAIVTEASAPVISAMGLAHTVACLDEGIAPDGRKAASRLAPGHGHVALYVRLEGDPAACPVNSANHWISESVDAGLLWRQPADADAPTLLVSFPSLKDPSWEGPPTAEVLAVADRSAFAPWLRGDPNADDYGAFKDWVAERLLAQFTRHFPALAPRLRFHEAATPWTQRRFVGAFGGSMYGAEMTVERLANDALRRRTPVPAGLLLAGQDVMGPGVQAAFMGRLMTAETVEPALRKAMGR
jgi:all-trans-retinol 13,14-reductase